MRLPVVDAMKIVFRRREKFAYRNQASVRRAAVALRRL